ncbi:MAG TPA: DUF4136 domain-containing protein [Pyrinomonadaceae bacterium]|jgi:hypothetical protein
MWIARVTGVLGFVLCVFIGLADAQSVQTDFDRSFDFSKLKTFNFAMQRRGAGDPLAKDSLNDGRIKTALGAHLMVSGFSMESVGKPDFAVAYYVTARDKVDVQEYRFGPFLGRRDIRVDQYTEGTLIVDIIDPATRKLVWRGYASSAIELKNVDEKINKAVEKLVKQFLKDTKRK